MCVFRSFYRSKSSTHPKIVRICIPQTNISDDDLQTSSGSDDFHVSSDESIDYESTEEKIIESGSEFEQDNTEEQLSSNSHVEIKFNWDSNVKWTTPQDAMLEEQNLQVKIEQDRRLNVYSSPWSLFSLFFTDEILKSHARGTKPVSLVSREGIKKQFGIILFMGIQKFPNRRMYWNPVKLSKVISESNMTRKRFDELLRVLHFNNSTFQKNPGEVGYNCLFKLQSIIDHFRHVLSTSVIPEPMLAVDEMMVAFKGRHKL